MARKQVIVQLDDKLVAELDKVARREGMSRSELLRLAAAALLQAKDTLRAEHKLIESYRRLPQDAAFIESAAKLAAETAPDW